MGKTMNNNGIKKNAKFYINYINENKLTFTQFFALIYYGGHFSDSDRSKIIEIVVKHFSHKWAMN